MMKKYFKIWWICASNTIQTQLVVKWAVALFILGKLLRFAIFIMFIIALLYETKVIAGYTLNQTLLFFLSFNLVDIITQLIFREVYRFRAQIISGSFDFYLIKPVSPLFRSLFGGPDVIDFFTLIPLVSAIIYLISKTGSVGLISIILYIFMIFMAFLIALSFHILVLSLAIITTEIDHTIMLYRDIMGMGRMPIDIYKEPVKGLLTFVIPVGIMMSFPVKSLLGLLSVSSILYSLIFSLSLLLVSLKIWKYALTKYSSASS